MDVPGARLTDKACVQYLQALDSWIVLVAGPFFRSVIPAQAPRLPQQAACYRGSNSAAAKQVRRTSSC